MRWKGTGGWVDFFGNSTSGTGLTSLENSKSNRYVHRRPPVYTRRTPEADFHAFCAFYVLM
ncbi:MAG: hypothetical protein QOJ51_6852 [Acidobacteriaceae bacterium]|jgi:hypothetical protein|nr:hypothetical protein [Acidobacteriaceae bacterium]MEA2264027.1 hypothetical protein [Acidobacteriaceae bacterium]